MVSSVRPPGAFSPFSHTSEVANTSPSLTYALVGRKTLNGADSEPRYKGIRGAGAGKELTLAFKDDPENQYRFYRVIRSK